MKNIINVFGKMLITIMVISFVACDDDDDDPKTTCVAGKGGAVTFILQPEHHGEAIPSTPTYPDSAWIKYNTSNFPGDNPALYDLIVVGTSGSASVTVDSMKCGNYFIYMTGFDTSIVERVRGGIPVTISVQSGNKIIKVPVTED
ncbi:MAG TPA: hypothetical protein PKD91_16265 [Bacteroidia bacterium]|nr:hypothetical protein [Bacteroidia bacterium]